MRPVYLDHHATTPLDPRVLEAMMPYLGARFGNASSRGHVYGWEAEEAVAVARERVAGLVGAAPEEIVFTSGATESDNLALLGTTAGGARQRVVTAATEHHAVLDACREIERRGTPVTVLPVEADGSLDLGRLEEAVAPGGALVSLMAANNEVGTLHPLERIGAIAREHGAVFHSDAAQGAGHVPIDVEEASLDLLSLSGHKMHGPKGVGALRVPARGRKLAPQAFGGGQERGLRPGTLNVPAIVGFGRACEIAREEMTAESVRVAGLRDRLERRLLAEAPGARVNGCRDRRLPGSSSVTFPGLDVEALLLAVQRNVALSTGAACASGSSDPSHVLLALGLTKAEARATLRFGVGRFNTEEEIDRAAAAVVRALRALAPASGG